MEVLGGMFIGGLLGGWLIHHLGKRTLFFVGPLVFLVFSLAQLGATSDTALCGLRLLPGIGVDRVPISLERFGVANTLFAAAAISFIGVVDDAVLRGAFKRGVAREVSLEEH